MSKLKEEEDHYCLNGWEDKEDNQPYGAVYIRRLQQKIEQVNNKLSESAKLPYRTHLKKKSRELIPPKINDISHLKRDREFLQQYLGNHSQPQTHRTFLQDTLPQCKAKTVVCATRMEMHQQHRSSQIDLRIIKCPQIELTNVSEKQLLFCGITKEKKKRRKYLAKINKHEQSTEKIKAFPMRKRLIMSETNKEKAPEECKFSYERVIKKGLKFPLFYREVNNKEHSNNISKNITLNSLHKKPSMCEMNSGQFTDDNIFENKFIRV